MREPMIPSPTKPMRSTGGDPTRARVRQVGSRPTSPSRPRRWATAAASVRLRTSSLARIRETWTLAVFSAMKSESPISRFVRPSATRTRTWRSRGVRPNGSSWATAPRRAVGRRAAVGEDAGARGRRAPSISPRSQPAPSLAATVVRALGAPCSPRRGRRRRRAPRPRASACSAAGYGRSTRLPRLRRGLVRSAGSRVAVGARRARPRRCASHASSTGPPSSAAAPVRAEVELGLQQRAAARLVVAEVARALRPRRPRRRRRRRPRGRGARRRRCRTRCRSSASAIAARAAVEVAGAALELGAQGARSTPRNCGSSMSTAASSTSSSSARARGRVALAEGELGAAQREVHERRCR